MAWAGGSLFYRGETESGLSWRRGDQLSKDTTACINGLIEPKPDKEFFRVIPGMKDELRRPMILLVSDMKYKRVTVGAFVFP